MSDEPRPPPRIPPPPPTALPKVPTQSHDWARSAEDLVAVRDLGGQKASTSYQGKRLRLAIAHVEAIELIHQPDSIATLAYDAIRAAVDVHMNANSLQIEGKDKHQLSVEYAHSEMADIVQTADLETYEELRVIRNKVLQYPDIGSHALLSDDDAARYRHAAAAIVGAVRSWRTGRTGPT